MRCTPTLAILGTMLALMCRGQEITEFSIPTASSEPSGIAVGSDGNLWFTENNGNQIGRITPSGTFTEFALPVGGSGPFDIAAGPDGNLWFTETNNNQIGRITPSGVITEFPIPTAASTPFGIAPGPDGNLWFSENTGNQIGRITVAGAITEFAIPTAGSQPWMIAAGPDGAVWFTEHAGNQIGRVTTGGTVTEFPIPTSGATPAGITSGPDGALWFTEDFANKIGRITTTGTITEAPLPAGGRPGVITTGPNVGAVAALWFAEGAFPGNIGRITMDGAITEFPVPSISAAPFGIAAHPDGRLWFTETNGGKIGRFTIAGLTSPASLAVDSAATAGTSSNANGVLEPGETVLVKPAWFNAATTPISVAGLGSNPTGPAGALYGLADDAADYGTIALGENGDCGADCYQFSVSNPSPRPAAHWDATFLETLSDGATKTWTLHVGESFGDVAPTVPVYRFVETLFHKGVTGGCGGGNYCPGDSTNRAQMAVFLLVSREGPSYQPPPATGTAFADVPASNPFAKWIEELARRGVTAGCGGGNYCPTASVTRAQMSVFLLVTLEGSGYTPPPAVGTFADVPASNPFARWIEELARRGVTAGCGGGNYCPNAAITRGQMAVFLTTTFGLSLYGAS